MVMLCKRTRWGAFIISLICMLNLARYAASVTVAPAIEQTTQQSLQSQTTDLVIPSFFPQRLDRIHTFSDGQRQARAYKSLIKTVYVHTDLPTALRLHLLSLIQQDLLLHMAKDAIDTKGRAQIYRLLQDVRHDIVKRTLSSRLHKKWLLKLVIAGTLIGLCAWLMKRKREENQCRVEIENEEALIAVKMEELMAIRNARLAKQEKYERMIRGDVTDDSFSPLMNDMRKYNPSKKETKIVQSIIEDLQTVEEGRYVLVIEDDVSYKSLVNGLDEDDEEAGTSTNNQGSLDMRIEGNRLYIPRSWVRDKSIIGTNYFHTLLTTVVGLNGQKNKEIRLSKLIMNKKMLKNFGCYIRNIAYAHKKYSEKSFLRFYACRPSHQLVSVLSNEIESMNWQEMIRMMLVAQEYTLFDLFACTEHDYYEKYKHSNKEKLLLCLESTGIINARRAFCLERFNID